MNDKTLDQSTVLTPEETEILEYFRWLDPEEKEKLLDQARKKRTPSQIKRGVFHAGRSRGY